MVTLFINRSIRGFSRRIESLMGVLYLVLVICTYLVIPLFLIWVSINVLSWFTVLVVLLLMQVVHLFSYFATIYQYSKYTTAVKFFWVRVLAVVWALEFYIFAVFIFLFIIAPAELYLFWDPTQHKQSKRWPTISSSSTYITCIILIFNVNILGYYTVYNNKIVGYLIGLSLVLGLIYIFLKELEMYYYYSLVSNFKKGGPILDLHKSSVLVLSNEMVDNIKPEDILRDCKTSSYLTVDLFAKQFTGEVEHKKARFFILNIILGIKFFHVYMIILVNLIYIYFTIAKKKVITLEVLGLWQQNLTVILIFWALNYVIYFKVYYKYLAYGFYSNIITYDLLGEWAVLFEEFYLI